MDPELYQQGVYEHARYLGIDPEADAKFLYIAEQSLVAPLPPGWTQVSVEDGQHPYYYNETTGESVWEHPSDAEFVEMFQQLKRKDDEEQQLHLAQNAQWHDPTSMQAHQSYEYHDATQSRPQMHQTQQSRASPGGAGSSSIFA